MTLKQRSCFAKQHMKNNYNLIKANAHTAQVNIRRKNHPIALSNLGKKASYGLAAGVMCMQLAGCDGFDINATDNVSTNTAGTKKFTRTELAFNALFSSQILTKNGLSSTREGYIALFKNTAELEQIKLRSNDSDSALVGTYAWTISNDKLQVTYPSAVICTSTKTAESASQYNASASCSGGSPNNAKISNTLIKAISLNKGNFSGSTITFDNGDDDFAYKFFTNGSVEITGLNNDGDEISSTTKTGIFKNSEVYPNIAVDLEIPEDKENKRTFFLIAGGVNSGVLIELRYKLPSTLNAVYLYEAKTSAVWKTISVYDDIRSD